MSCSPLASIPTLLRICLNYCAWSRDSRYRQPNIENHNATDKKKSGNRYLQPQNHDLASFSQNQIASSTDTPQNPLIDAFLDFSNSHQTFARGSARLFYDTPKVSPNFDGFSNNRWPSPCPQTGHWELSIHSRSNSCPGFENAGVSALTPDD